MSIFLTILATVILFVCPIILLISVIGHIKIGSLEINLNNLEKKKRIIIGIVSTVIWLATYIPITNMTNQWIRSISEPLATAPTLVAGESSAPTQIPPTSAPTETTLPSAPTPTFTLAPTETASSTPTETATPGPSLTPLPVEVVEVPEGIFNMGSSYSETRSFYPVHEVFTDQFYIDKYEVTNAQYAQCVEARVCSPPTFSGSYTRDHYSDNLDEYGNYPVIFVTWENAKTFCEWRNGRLPTEAEWEKAAKWHPHSGITSFYPWGDSDPDATKVNFRSEDTLEVGQFPNGASYIGVHDMAGNVLEWVADIFSSTFYEYSPERNPTGPQTTEGERVLRGGGWSNIYNSDLWTFWRYHQDPAIASDNVGFRCASDNPPQ